MQKTAIQTIDRCVVINDISEQKSASYKGEDYGLGLIKVFMC